MLSACPGNIKFKAANSLKDTTEALEILISSRFSEIRSNSVTMIERANTRPGKVTLRFQMGIDCQCVVSQKII